MHALKLALSIAVISVLVSCTNAPLPATTPVPTAIPADETCRQLSSVVELEINMSVAARDGRLTEEEIDRTLTMLSNILQFVDVEKRTELSSAIIDLRESIHNPDSSAYGDAMARVDAACTAAGAIFLPVRWTGG